MASQKEEDKSKDQKHWNQWILLGGQIWEVKEREPQTESGGFEETWGGGEFRAEDSKFGF